MLICNTPVENYRIGSNSIFVKREDLCTAYPAPPFSKCRGLYQYLQRIKSDGIRVVGYLETPVSMGGIAVSYFAQRLGLKAVIFCPKYKKEESYVLIRKHEQWWNKFSPDVIHIKPNYMSVNYYRSKKMLMEKYGSLHCEMLPNGLEFDESIEQTCQEYERSLSLCEPKSVVVCVGSGIICAGILRASSKESIYGVLIHDKNVNRKLNFIYEKSGNLRGGLFGKSNLTLVNPGWQYTEKSNIKSPFPCHPYYDLKAWQWLVENIDRIKKPVLFWNIGREIENLT